MRQARITKSRVEAPQDVSFLFLEAWMVDMRGGSEEVVLMVQGDERRFYCAFCPPEMQTVSREIRDVWHGKHRWILNAVDILIDKETCQLTDASRETYPMQRVDRQGRTSARR